MAFGIMAIAQLINAVLALILSIKLSLTYKERKNVLTLLLMGFFLFLLAMSLLYFYVEFFELHTVQLAYWTGDTLVTTVLIYMVAYLLTISLYILEIKILYLIPATVSIELMILGILIPEPVFLMIRFMTLLIFNIPTVILFIYLTIKNNDGKSLGFVCYLVTMLFAGPLTRVLDDFTGILYIIAFALLFLGQFGAFEKLLNRERKEKAWIEEIID